MLLATKSFSNELMKNSLQSVCEISAFSCAVAKPIIFDAGCHNPQYPVEKRLEIDYGLNDHSLLTQDDVLITIAVKRSKYTRCVQALNVLGGIAKCMESIIELKFGSSRIACF